MGIDAKMLLRLKGPKPTDKQIALWGDALCRSIGAKHFFISDGLPPPEHHKASEAWHAAFNAHPLYAEMEEARKRDNIFSGKTDDSWRSIRERIAADIGEHPDERRRAVELTNYIYPFEEGEDGDVPQQYREPGRCWTQDGDPIFAEPGEWFLSVSLYTRYYGIGYERGDLLTLCAVAEWCEVNIPNCTVWYGGDSSGVLAEPWPDKKRRELRRHLYGEQGRAYFNYSSRYGHSTPHPAPCGLCIDGGSFEQFGSGPNYVAVSCASCGKSFQSRDGGETWQDHKEAA